jgi:hypothetical protein
MSAITLQQVGTTRLYQATGPHREYLVFLLWDEDEPPPPAIGVDDTWSDGEPPKRLGWYVFTDAKTPDAALEKALRAALPEPALTSFGWASDTAPGLAFDARLPVQPDPGGAPVVESDVTVALPPGLTGIGFAAGAPVRASRDGSANVIGFTFGYPPDAGGPPAADAGIFVPLSTPAAGTIGFTGFVNADDAPRQDRVVKSLVYVQTDPVRPFDRARTFTNLTGRDFLFVHADGDYRLEPVEQGGA